MAERRRLSVLAERDVGDWLWAHAFLNDKAGTNIRFAAEILTSAVVVLRVRLVDVPGAIAFIPAPSGTPFAMNWWRSRKTVRQLVIKGETVYKVTDVIDALLLRKFALKPAALLPDRQRNHA